MEGATKMAIFAQLEEGLYRRLRKLESLLRWACDKGNGSDFVGALYCCRGSLYGLRFGRDRQLPSLGSGRQDSFAFASEVRCERDVVFDQLDAPFLFLGATAAILLSTVPR